MSRWNLIVCFLLTVAIHAGCSMCCGPYDYEYPILQSNNYPRLNPEYGRVGSVFSDPNVVIGPAPLTNADIPPEESDSGSSPDDDGADDDPDSSDPPPLDDLSTPPNTDEIDTNASLQIQPPRRW